MTPRRAVTSLILVLLAAAALHDLGRLNAAAPWRNMDDFADFYCAGAALDARSSPYTYEPLHSCEHRVNVGETFRARLFAANPAVAVPAPQPAFDFIPFMVLAKFSFSQARSAGAVAILVAVALCVVMLAALRIPWTICAAALALSTAYAELNTGQIVPFALLALASCGLALARRRDTLAGVLAALTAVEPTIGLPVLIATLLFVPRSRAAALLTLAGLAAASVALIGLRGASTYLTSVLPAHAGSELHFPFQYSFTYVAAYFGLPSAAARLVGALSYCLLTVIGVFLARRTSAALGRRELLAFVPALCAVIGGAFLHAEELCFAIPALLVFAYAGTGTARVVAALALCTLSIPWILVWGTKQLFLASLFVCAAILFELRIDPRVAAVSLAAFATLIYVFELHPPHLPLPATANASYGAGELAQRAWSAYTEARRTSDPLWFAVKLPTWIALLAALAMAARLTPRSRPASESSL